MSWYWPLPWPPTVLKTGRGQWGVMDRGCAVTVQAPLQIHPTSFCRLLPTREDDQQTSSTGCSPFQQPVSLSQWRAQTTECREGEGGGQSIYIPKLTLGQLHSYLFCSFSLMPFRLRDDYTSCFNSPGYCTASDLHIPPSIALLAIRLLNSP